MKRREAYEDFGAIRLSNDRLSGSTPRRQTQADRPKAAIIACEELSLKAFDCGVFQFPSGHGPILFCVSASTDAPATIRVTTTTIANDGNPATDEVCVDAVVS